jgi:four helix bundle protein
MTAIGSWHLAFGRRRSGGIEMKDFRQLEVWTHAHQLTLALYASTRRFPKEELYGLTSQIRRCSASIAANIAEGCGRRGNAEFHRFLQMASGSASELDYHRLLARDLSLFPEADYQKLTGLLTRVRRMLTSLIRKVATDRDSNEY